MDRLIKLDGKTYRVMNPLGEAELEAARKNRKRLAQYNRPYTVVDYKSRTFAKRYYRKRGKRDWK